MEAVAGETVRALSASEVRDELRAAITGGELVPNQRLVEADLVEQFRASRGSVRPALAELNVEGLVEQMQNRGARVRVLSEFEAVEILEARAAVEALRTRKAAECITEEEACSLKSIASSMTDALERGDRDSYSQFTQRLPRRVVEVSGHQTAAVTIQRLRNQSLRFELRALTQPGHLAVSLPQHEAIINAICANNPEAAAQAMRNHLEDVARFIRPASHEGNPPTSICTMPSSVKQAAVAAPRPLSDPTVSQPHAPLQDKNRWLAATPEVSRGIKRN